ncbi:UV-stimulated scaffold protein A-like [Brevipalpus obovatus]|uniref:UV-stimulated scaffold protein A-like n=1 Tax=Brevipalpus obovatus TaxID=246614 RepID=UPI003D9F2F04
MAVSSDEIGSIVEKITTCGRKDVDEDLVKKLKQMCKERGDPMVEQIFRMLMFQMVKKHSQIRYCTLLMIHEFFQRSHHFRTLLLKSENLQNFFESCLGISEDHPLPPPKAWRGELKKKCIECIDIWYNKFREGYPSLATAYNYFKRTCIDFREQEIITQEDRRQLEAEEERKKQVLRKKVDKHKDEFKEIKVECESVLSQMFNCFQLLFPWLQQEDLVDHEDTFDIPPENFVSPVQGVDIVVRPYLEVIQSEDNKHVIENLRDIYHQMVKECMPKLKSNLKSMTEGSEFCGPEIRMAIDLKSQMMMALQKFIKLKIVTPEENNGDDNSDSDEDFEEVQEKEDIEFVIPQHRRKEYGLDDDISSLDRPSTSKEDQGIMCKVPLINGKLCPRKDAIKCPFHGKIIPRDEMGIPLDENERKKELEAKKSDVPEWQDPAFLRDLEAATGIDLTVKKGRGKSKKAKDSLLQDLRTCDETPRNRLKKKIFRKDARERVAKDLDTLDAKRSRQFHDQWNYALER